MRANPPLALSPALKKSHPYEEPAYDLIPLEPLDDRVGLGRVGKLARAVTVETLLRKIKRNLKTKTLRLIGSAKRKVGTVAVGAGSISDMMPPGRRQKGQKMGSTISTTTNTTKVSGMPTLV